MDEIKQEFVAVRGEIQGVETALRQKIRGEAIAYAPTLPSDGQFDGRMRLLRSWAAQRAAA